jgi:hypothetical protein
MLDIASTPTANDPYANEKDAFKAAVTAVEVATTAGGATDGGHAAVLEDYHARLVPPFCLSAVKSFFDGQGWLILLRAREYARAASWAGRHVHHRRRRFFRSTRVRS